MLQAIAYGTQGWPMSVVSYRLLCGNGHCKRSSTAKRPGFVAKFFTFKTLPWKMNEKNAYGFKVVVCLPSALSPHVPVWARIVSL